jgi:hypothetical protein
LWEGGTYSLLPPSPLYIIFGNDRTWASILSGRRVPTPPRCCCAPCPALLARHAPPAQPSQGWWWWCSRAATCTSAGSARRPSLAAGSDLNNWNRPPLASPVLQSACFKCFRWFISILQVFHMDVAKVDQDVTHFQCLYTYVARVCSNCFVYFRCMLQVFLSRCYICCVASVYSKCFIHLLQLFSSECCKTRF